MQTYSETTGGRTHVGVLPLSLIGPTGADPHHLGIALAEEISSALSRFRVVIIVSTSWLAHFAGDDADEAAIRSECGVDFLVRGSIQWVGAHLRIWLRLVDLRTGHRVGWAHRFDRENHDFLSLLDEIAVAAVGQIIPQVLRIESDRTAVDSLDGATAYNLVLRAVQLMMRMDRVSFFEASEYLARAIDREPDYSPAYTWYAFWQLFLVAQGWAQDSSAVTRKSEALAAKAVSLDPGDAFAVTVNAHISVFQQRHLIAAANLHERALTLNPNLAMAWALSAITHTCMGEWVEAEKRYNHYQKFSPFDPSHIFFASLPMQINLLKRDYEAVVAAGRAATQLVPLLRDAYKPYLSALGHLGRTQESAFVRARLLSIEPDFSVEGYITTSALERACDRQHLAKGLRLAGVS
jgi:TolB-like protein